MTHQPEYWYLLWTIDPGKPGIFGYRPLKVRGREKYSSTGDATNAGQKWNLEHPECQWTFEVKHNYGELP